MSSTIRRCNDCGYETFIFNDSKKERDCKHCRGLLNIIATDKIPKNKKNFKKKTSEVKE